MQGLQADRTVVPCRIGQTGVTLKSRRFHADAALVTVHMRRRAADTADAALVAVVLPLVLVVQQNADGAPVQAHDDVAPCADLAGGLFERTLRASHGLHQMPIHCMRLLHILFVFQSNLVVTEPATKELIATGSEQHGFPFVMNTGHFSRHGDKSLD